jgi:hypothetical protein
MAIQSGWTLVPRVNLVRNIGFEGDSTNAPGMIDRYPEYSNTPVEEVGGIVHPKIIMPDGEADRIRFEIIRRTDPRLEPRNRLKRRIKQALRTRGLYGRKFE